MVRARGLWLQTLYVTIERVTTRHRKECEHCEKLPAARRLFIIRGSGRSAKTHILCIKCGVKWIEAVRVEAARAQEFLRFGACVDGNPVRLAAE